MYVFMYVGIAFLSSDVMELRHYHVDLNPVYAESIDVDHFTVHLMFEISNSETAGANRNSRSFSLGKRSQALTTVLYVCARLYIGSVLLHYVMRRRYYIALYNT